MYIQSVDIKTEKFYKKIADKRLFKIEVHIPLLKQREYDFQILHIVFENVGKDIDVVNKNSTIFSVFL